MTRLRGALASRNFRLLVGCDVTSMVGTAMASVAVPFAVLRVGGSASDIGFVSAAGLVPTIVFLLFGGVAGDRLPRQQVMLLANLGQGAAQAGFAVLVLTGHARIWELMALNAGRGGALGFYLPAAQGLLPQTVDPVDLPTANSIRRLGLNAAQICGAALGGIVVGVVGPGWGLVADAASYAVAATLRAGMTIEPVPQVERAGLIPELREGWQTFASRSWLWSIVAQFGVVNALFAGAFTVLGPVIADHHLGGARSWGLILAAESVGAVLGAAMTLRWRPARLLLAATLAALAIALPIFALAVPLDLPLVAAAALLAGVGAEFFEVNWSIALQQEIPPNLLARVSAYDALGSYALGPIGTLVAGPVALAIGVTATLATGGGLVVMATVAVLFVRDVRQLTRRSPPADPDRC
jgi:MFS family permease